MKPTTTTFSATRRRSKPTSILRDDAETAKLKFFADHLQEVENNLPIDPQVSQSEARQPGRRFAW